MQGRYYRRASPCLVSLNAEAPGKAFPGGFSKVDHLLPGQTQSASNGKVVKRQLFPKCSELTSRDLQGAGELAQRGHSHQRQERHKRLATLIAQTEKQGTSLGTRQIVDFPPHRPQECTQIESGLHSRTRIVRRHLIAGLLIRVVLDREHHTNGMHEIVDGKWRPDVTEDALHHIDERSMSGCCDGAINQTSHGRRSTPEFGKRGERPSSLGDPDSESRVVGQQVAQLAVEAPAARILPAQIRIPRVVCDDSEIRLEVRDGISGKSFEADDQVHHRFALEVVQLLTVDRTSPTGYPAEEDRPNERPSEVLKERGDRGIATALITALREWSESAVEGLRAHEQRHEDRDALVVRVALLRSQRLPFPDAG